MRHVIAEIQPTPARNGTRYRFMAARAMWGRPIARLIQHFLIAYDANRRSYQSIFRLRVSVPTQASWLNGANEGQHNRWISPICLYASSHRHDSTPYSTRAVPLIKAETVSWSVTATAASFKEALRIDPGGVRSSRSTRRWLNHNKRVHFSLIELPEGGLSSATERYTLIITSQPRARRRFMA